MGRLQKESQRKKAEKVEKKDKKKKEEVEENEEDENEFEDVEEDEEDEENKGNNSNDKKITLYDLLDVSGNASIEEIKKSYKKLALKIHPDKNRNDPEAKEKFQKIVEAYNILSDPEKKKIYDETGSYGDEFNEHAFEAAYNYYRTIYKKIEKEDIEDFEKKYRNSAMEEEDLINFYNENKGDMTTILECIPLSRNEDVSRFLKKYEELFVAEKIKIFKAFNKTKNQIRLLDEDEEEGYQEVQNGLKDLASQILAKKGNAASFLDSLAEKYGGVENKKTKKQGNKQNDKSTKAKSKK